MESVSSTRRAPYEFVEFFSGSGLVSYALREHFQVVWANDNSKKKAEVYTANHGMESFHLKDINLVKGGDIPESSLSWASFPCQDLSLAGASGGIHAERSGLVWQWLRVLDEMKEKPPILVAENVVGLVSAKGGTHYQVLHRALVERGYKAGAILLDAVQFIPQSRPRIFVIAVHESVPVPSKLIGAGPSWLHSKAVQSAAIGLENWIWWHLPIPEIREQTLEDLVEWDAPCDDEEKTAKNLALIPERHLNRLLNEDINVAPGYKRTRNGKQTLELRFDNIAGCLRTPQGGSSRQLLVLKKDGKLSTRLLTAREIARLMGAPDEYKLPGSYNDGYKAMGDAVAVPVAEYLANQLLSPLMNACLNRMSRSVV
ncbi:DNA (cytosine-5-)-methyltransferase [Saccharibacillus sp. O23]|uniref:DNA cytosine methyltransferase n=1 Tax=Saccharibacillus sp. O23 TaxID=2009338 RepID=UPI000B4E4A30|nr:DNA cytosine methyltransferase [Saccharibacillus sp. O23]OWR33150.1 DNA (cytosine-5-)-methyltransferase [Saccharibacillus sp. O23]